MHPSAIRVLPRLHAEALGIQEPTVCISIRNPRQSDAHLGDYSAVLRLGFHDHDWPTHMFTVMSLAQATQVLDFARAHHDQALVVHCEYGASRSVAVGLFLAAWLERPLSLTVPVLLPNPWVIRQLRLAGLWSALRWRDLRLARVALKGPLAYRYAVLPQEIAATY